MTVTDGTTPPADRAVVEAREREDKYDVEASFALPALDAVTPSGARIETAQFRLSSTYYDTATSDLRRNRLTLRRREGDTDTGWHLKLPASKATANARTEVRLPDGPQLPDELNDVLIGVRRGADLEPVGRLVTRRSVHRLLDADGELLAEVADDAVTATDLRTGDPSHGVQVRGGSVTASSWREIEVEAGPSGTEELLARVGDLLIAAGARPSTSPSKLVRALGPTPQRPPIDADSTLADLVSQYVGTQAEAIVAGDLGLRLGHDVVHPTRVAIRRLRSTLRTFSALFDPDAAQALEGELVWFAGLLGGVRDADVLRERLDRLVAELPGELVLGPVAATIDNQLAAERAEHWRELTAQLQSPRLFALLDEVERWRLAPPFTAEAEAPADKVAKRLGKSRRQLRRRLDRAGDATHDQEELVHAARKAGKRYRYAAELAEPELGHHAKAKVAEAEALQDLLGEHQDSVVSAAALRRFGAVAGSTPGENGFTFGILLEAELRRAADIRAEISRRQGRKTAAPATEARPG